MSDTGTDTAKPVHLAVYDTYADRETGHTTAWLARGGHEIRTVGASAESVRTVAGVRIQPDGVVSREQQDLLSRTALGVFRLNGQFLSVAEELARPAGLTAAWWQVLGAVLPEPLPVAGIARVMGITRQSVQRVADLLVDRGLAEYVPNPAHRRAKLLTPTPEGRAAIAEIDPGHAALAARLAEALGEGGFAETVRVLERLSGALDGLAAAPAAVTEP